MIIGLLGLAIATILFGYGATYTQLVVARMGQGISGGISWTIGLCMIADIFPSSRLGEVMGKVMSVNSIGFLVGPPLGGFLYDYAGQQSPYLFCGGLALLDLAARLFVKPEAIEKPQEPEEEPLLQDSEEDDSETALNSNEDLLQDATSTRIKRPASINDLLTDFQVISTSFSIFLGACVFSGLEPSLPIHVQKEFGMDPSSIGMLFVALIIPSVAAGWIVGPLSDQHGRKNISALGFFLYGLSCIAIACSNNLMTLGFSLGFFGAAQAIQATPCLPELAEHVDRLGGGAYATIYALFNMAYSGGMVVGPMVGGYLVDKLSFQMQMLVFGSLLILWSPFLLLIWYLYVRRPNMSLERSVSLEE